MDDESFPILTVTGIITRACAAPEMGVDRRSGPPPPLKNHKNIGFLSNSGPDPLKTTKLPSQHSMLGYHQHTSETPFKWRFAGRPIMAHL